MMKKEEKGVDYLELEQPEGVPKVKVISKEKLDEKLSEVIIKPQQVKPIGGNTLPPYYSREMSRYEPPIPVKQKEKEEVLEKVKEMTSKGSKDSIGEKQMEGDTDLSWDHEGLDTPPKTGKTEPSESPKPPRSPKISKDCLLYTSPSPRDATLSRMPSSA